ncbi:hypothetical protein JNW88_08170 [Micromonospora sp. ATA32]|nr:hypothetical protein [Micromonospora sp. ATA32]
MTTDIRTKALDVVTAAANGQPILPGNRLPLTKAVRDSITASKGRAPMTLGPIVEAVDWAIEQVNATNLDRCRQPDTYGGWAYRFPNGHEASVINDPHRPFRFEVCSKSLNVPGDVVPGLTSEQVEAKLHDIAALPAR